MWFPNELWTHIKDYIFDYYSWWKYKMQDVFSFINCLKPNIKRWSLTPRVRKNEHLWSVESIYADYGMPFYGRAFIYKII